MSLPRLLQKANISKTWRQLSWLQSILRRLTPEPFRRWRNVLAIQMIWFLISSCTSQYVYKFPTEIAFYWPKPLRIYSQGPGHRSNFNIVLKSQFSSVAQSCPILYDPIDHSTPGLLVHHQLPEFIQTHVHWVGDAIQPSHPLSPPSPPSLSLSQHQGLFQWVVSSH